MTSKAMEDTDQLIKAFAQKIIDNDMVTQLLEVQQKQWGRYVKNPLPIDSAGGPSPILFTQLLRTVGDAADRFDIALRAISPNPPDRGMICAAAASGMGKTHLAYDVGRKYFLIMLRVMGNSGDCNGDQASHKSPPWDAALQYMTQLKSNSLVEDSPLIRANGMLRYIHILLYTYIEFTISALTSGPQLDMVRRKEFVLRLHRNEVADDLIKILFEKNVENLKNDMNSYICEGKFCAYRKSVIESMQEALPTSEKLVLCVDEINGLATDFLSDFVRQTRFENANTLLDGEQPESKGLMYALFCVLKNISAENPSWYCYVTGTALSVAKFQGEIDGISVARNFMSPVSPDVLLSVDDMLSILNHYFSFNDDAIEVLRNKLAQFVGRPQFFARGVFEPLFNRLPKASQACQLTCAIFDGFQWIDNRYRSLVQQYTDRYKRTFGPEPQCLPFGVKNMKTMLPSVVCACLSGGVYSLRTEDVLEGAVYTGILPIGVNVEQNGVYKIDLKREPIIHEAVANFVRSRILQENGIPKLLSIMSDVGGEKGKIAEWIFCMYVVLCVEKMRLQQRVLDLRTLFFGLTRGIHHDYIPLECDDYEVLCTEIVDMESTTDSDTPHQSFLRTLVNAETNQYNYKSILVNIDNYAGVNIVFVVRPRKGREGDPRLVAIHVKHRSSGTSLDDSLLTLSPGCQYLTSEERTLFLTAFYNNACVKNLPTTNVQSVGFGKILQKDHNEVCQNHPALAVNWIRVCLVARPVADGLMELIRDLRQNRYRSTWSAVLRDEWKMEKISQSLDASPLVVLSTISESYLMQVGRDRPIIGNAVPSALSKPRQYRKWVTITTSDVANLLR